MQNHNHEHQLLLELIRRDRLLDYAPLAAPASRTRYWAFALMVLMLIVSLYLFISTSQMLERFQGRLADVEDSDSARIRQYNEKLESLQNRMTVFVADSVETKLKNLEKNVTAGTVGTQEIKTLEELKSEVKLLETYSIGKRANLTDPTRLDHARFQPVPGSQSTVIQSGDLLYEISKMKRLLYLGIASCGLVGLLLGGYWWQRHFRAKQLAAGIPNIPLLARKLEENR
jgi:hypothetical protein